MAKKKIKIDEKNIKEKDTKKTEKKIKVKSKTEGLGLGPINYIILAAGLISILVGYFLLKQGSITLSPILLVLGYVVLIPIGLILNLGKKKNNIQESKDK